MENAEEIFDTLIRKGKVEVDRLIAERKAENYFLDYKTSSRDSRDDDTNNLANALSGFANTEGGIVIWGVKKSDGKKGSYSLIQEPHNFIERLNRMLSQLVLPAVEGVDSRLIFEDKAGGDKAGGVVATFIPKSYKTPHQNLRDHKYYFRVGDSFKPMKHTQIEDMFGRRANPQLDLLISLEPLASQNGRLLYRLNILLSNTGRAMTRYFGFDLQFPVKFLDPHLEIHRRFNCVVPPKVGNLGVIKYRNDLDAASSPLFPGDTIEISPNQHRMGSIKISLTPEQKEAMSTSLLAITIYSENAAPRISSFSFGDILLDRR